MRLELSDMDISDLRELIDARLVQLLNEIAHADVRAYRAALQEKEARLEALKERLELLGEDARVAHS